MLAVARQGLPLTRSTEDTEVQRQLITILNRNPLFAEGSNRRRFWEILTKCDTTTQFESKIHEAQRNTTLQSNDTPSNFLSVCVTKGLIRLSD
jgi:hypothetical protein